MVAEEVVVTLSGGAPWGFRLQGGVEHQTPLQVSKVRLVCGVEWGRWNNRLCVCCTVGCGLGLGNSRCILMAGSGRQSSALLCVLRCLPGHESGVHTVALSGRTPTHIATHTHTPTHPVLSPTDGPACLTITSPPDSEAYYGETDSDADTHTHTHRRQRRTPPHTRSPGRQQQEEETSDNYPHLETGEPTGGREAEGEGDSGFQEAGLCVGLACSPLVSPERAKGAMMLGSSRQMVPMVGAQLTPLSDDLSTTYKDKARQAKLQRGESVVDRQVKEARTKCRSIASLLTDAPYSNSKGVLMFKKRRQRAKKFTLTCFGRAEGEVEVDEEGFAGTFDPTWDSGYLDLLDRRSSACPSTYNSRSQTPTNQSSGLDSSAYQSPEINQRKRVTHPDLNPNPNPPGGIHNRTACPFTSGLAPSRPPVTPVIFRPVQPTPAVTMVSKPTAAVSMVTIAPPRPSGGPQARRAVSSTSLYIPPRPAAAILFPPTALPLYPSSAVAAQSFSAPPSINQSFPPSYPTPYSHPPPLAQTQPPPPLTFNPYVATATPSTAQPPSSDSLSSREQRIAVPASRTGILAEARRRSNKKPMFRPSVENKKDVSPNPALLELLQNPDAPTRMGPRPGVETGGESGPEEDWLRLGAEACNFMQARRGPKPPPVAPKTQGLHRYPSYQGRGVSCSPVDRAGWIAITPSSPQPSPCHPRQPSPTLSLPSQFRYSSSCRAPPPISYNPLLSPSCPPQAQRQRAGVAGQGARPAGHKAAPGGQKAQGIKALDFMSRQPYQLNSSLFSYGGGTPQQAQAYQQQPRMMGGSYGPIKTPRVYEIKRFSTPPPTGPSPTIIVPRSATTLGEPLWRSDIISPLPIATPCYQSPSNTPYPPQPQWPSRVPRPRFSTSNLGLQPSVWRPGSTTH
ncbi:unnamed protein product [Oncorhynchus mykiss]|uniref:Synaptopodin 2-like protein n=1 Tax=Oncorhynchus mykiss TaxID=8022 RepID=A0A060Y0I4_ONCMY|nr:unnamed protein product [Oncorhynchus mykiss]